MTASMIRHAALAVLLTAGALGMSGLAHASNVQLSLDSAGVEDLAKLDHVGPELAARIVALRSERGGHLGSIEALRVVPGISEAALSSLRHGVFLDVPLPDAATRTYSSPAEVMAEFANEPSVQQVQAWANDYAKTSPVLVERWLAQSKTFAALPQLTVQYRYQRDFDQDFRYYATDGSIDSQEDEAGLFALLDGAGVDGQSQYLVRARWDLNELVMSSERIRVINEAQDLVKLRDKVLTEANRLYFERRRVQVDMLLSPKRDVMGLVKDQLRLMEITAGLDALTGGGFSAAVARGASAGAAAR